MKSKCDENKANFLNFKPNTKY